MKSKPRKRQLIRDGRIAKPMLVGFYPVIDTDLARDNIENDQPAAELEDL